MFPSSAHVLQFPPAGEKEEAQRIREQCQRRYMRPVSEIDASILERLARQIGMVPSREDKHPKGASQEHKQGLARQNGGYRGRKAQEKRIQHSLSLPKTASSEEVKTGTTGEITTMNWEETVGSPSEETDEEEPEDDPGD
jgi:hypothetical protein